MRKCPILPLKVWVLAEIYDSNFGHFKSVDWIFVYGSCFVLFLVVECSNQIENISNNITVMIFSSIELWAGKG